MHLFYVGNNFVCNLNYTKTQVKSLLKNNKYIQIYSGYMCRGVAKGTLSRKNENVIKGILLVILKIN